MAFWFTQASFGGWHLPADLTSGRTMCGLPSQAGMHTELSSTPPHHMKCADCLEALERQLSIPHMPGSGDGGGADLTEVTRRLQLAEERLGSAELRISTLEEEVRDMSAEVERIKAD